MLRLLALLLGLCVLRPTMAQERIAHVRLDDGTKLSGRVVEMSLAALRIQVGHEVLTIDADRIRDCQIEREGGAGETPASTPEAAPQDPPVKTEPSPQTPPEAAPVSPAGVAPANPADHAGAVADGASTAAPLEETKPAAKRGRRAAPQDPAVAAVPQDLRGVSRWRQRLAALDQSYPWLVPSAPTQWWSIGLLLAIGLSLIVHLSANVAGGEGISLSRSTGLGMWYFATAMLQFAFVPVSHFSIVLMLLGNTSIALFALCSLFGLSRGASVIAFAVQLGCLVIGYGVLELVTSLLASTGAIS